MHIILQSVSNLNVWKSWAFKLFIGASVQCLVMQPHSLSDKLTYRISSDQDRQSPNGTICCQVNRLDYVRLPQSNKLKHYYVWVGSMHTFFLFWGKLSHRSGLVWLTSNCMKQGTFKMQTIVVRLVVFTINVRFMNWQKWINYFRVGLGLFHLSVFFLGALLLF